MQNFENDGKSISAITEVNLCMHLARKETSEEEGNFIHVHVCACGLGLDGFANMLFWEALRK